MRGRATVIVRETVMASLARGAIIFAHMCVPVCVFLHGPLYG